MKPMKMSEVRNWTAAELEQKIKESKDALFRARMKHTRRQLEDPILLRQTRRNIARLTLVLNEKKEKTSHGK